jgi:phosphoglycolate phosphatase
MSHAYDVVVWDFNGTVLDDAQVALDAENSLLIRRGLAPMSMEFFRSICPFPVIDYYRATGLDVDAEGFDALAAEYMRAYQPASLGAPLRAKTMRAIECLTALGVRQVLLSASKRALLLEQLHHFGIADRFERILGVGDIYAHGKADVARAWMAEENLRPDRVVMVGDTTHDHEVAQTLGCACALLEGGQQSEQRLRGTGRRVYPDAMAWYEESF